MKDKCPHISRVPETYGIGYVYYCHYTDCKYKVKDYGSNYCLHPDREKMFDKSIENLLEDKKLKEKNATEHH